MKKEIVLKMWDKINWKDPKTKIFYQFDENKIVSRLNVPDQTIYVLKDPECVNSQGMGFAITCNFGSFYAIIIDDFYEEAPENLRKFILEHEIGHIVNGDHSKSWSELYEEQQGRRYGKIPQCEFDADMRAAQELGYQEAIEALRFMRDNTDCPIGTARELTKRIRYIEKMQKIESLSERQKERYKKNHTRNMKIVAFITAPYFVVTITIAIVVAILIAAVTGKLSFKSLKVMGQKIKAIIKQIISKHHKL